MTAKLHDRKSFTVHASNALDRGGTIEQRDAHLGGYVLWNVAGRCSAPVYRELRTGVPLAGAKIGNMLLAPDRPVPFTNGRYMEMHVRCRKCPACLKARAAHWRKLAEVELATSPRTWFGTLTLTSDQQFIALSRARRRLAASGEDYDAITEARKFRALVDQINPEITKWLKRVRKNSNARFRYMLVSEAHVSGLPHFHVLVHEVSIASPVRHRVLSDAWKIGFSKFNLVEGGRPAAYLCKYLSKSLLSRVRASQGYGHPQLETASKVPPPEKGGREEGLTH